MCAVRRVPPKRPPSPSGDSGRASADWRSLLPFCPAPASPSDRAAGDLLLQFTSSARSLREGLLRIYGPRGFNDHKFIVLVALNAMTSHTSTPSALADYAGITRASMTDVLDGLARRRWIVRHRDPENRRSVRVKLTVAGRHALMAVAQDYFELSSHLLRSVPPDDLAAFARVCAFLHDVGARLAPHDDSTASS